MRVRQLRSERGLTLADVAKATGISAAMLSLVERGMTSPSIGTLVAICDALSVPMAELFPGDRGTGPVVRRSEQAEVTSRHGVTRRILVDERELELELTEHLYEPGGSTSPVATHHQGWEAGLVLEGGLHIEIDGVLYELGAGDVVQFSSKLPHRFFNDGAGPSRAVWVNVHGSPGRHQGA